MPKQIPDLIPSWFSKTSNLCQININAPKKYHRFNRLITFSDRISAQKAKNKNQMIFERREGQSTLQTKWNTFLSLRFYVSVLILSLKRCISFKKFNLKKENDLFVPFYLLCAMRASHNFIIKIGDLRNELTKEKKKQFVNEIDLNNFGKMIFFVCLLNLMLFPSLSHLRFTLTASHFNIRPIDRFIYDDFMTAECCELCATAPIFFSNSSFYVSRFDYFILFSFSSSSCEHKFNWTDFGFVFVFHEMKYHQRRMICVWTEISLCQKMETFFYSVWLMVR